MYSHHSVLAAVIIISAFSLAWLIVGVFMGQGISTRLFAVSRNRTQKGREKRGSQGGRSSEIYVGNLSYNMTEKDLRKIFQDHGTVKSVRLIKNRFNGKSKGFGFVEMADFKQGADAIDALHNKEIGGRKIIVNEAKSSARD